MKLSSFLAGIGVGATVALLFAPKSGDETREMLSEKAEEGRRYAAARVQDLRDQAQDLRDQANDVAERGKKAVARQADAVTAAAHAAKDTYKRESHAS